MNLFVNDPAEGWIVDRIRDEFLEFTSHEIVDKPEDADIIWLIAPWVWAQIPVPVLKEKFVICTIHHIDPSKFDLREFELRDEFVDHYFTQDVFTYHLIDKGSDSPVMLTDYWCNKEDFFPLSEEERTKLKEELGIPEDKLIFGSFQRDTEGHDLASPKLSKGPDRYVAIMKALKEAGNDSHVVLAGWRRQYIMAELDKLEIPYSYFEKADVERLNELYNVIDLYLVTSRHEGGPQALFEASLAQKPILSTRVGSAQRTLHPYSICKDEGEMANRIHEFDGNSVTAMVTYNYKKALNQDIRRHIKVYDEIIENCWKVAHEDTD